VDGEKSPHTRPGLTDRPEPAMAQKTKLHQRPTF
jgi:hypothetical protein